jgi:hypothetical protein
MRDDSTLKTINYLKTGDTSDFENEVKPEEEGKGRKLLRTLREKGPKSAKEQLDEYLGEGVESLAKGGEVDGNIAAGLAAGVSTAADFLLPESAGEAAMAVVPGGRALSKLKMPARKALKAGEEVVENVLDYSNKAFKPTSTKTGATKGWQDTANTGVEEAGKTMKQLDNIKKVPTGDKRDSLNRAAALEKGLPEDTNKLISRWKEIVFDIDPSKVSKQKDRDMDKLLDQIEIRLKERGIDRDKLEQVAYTQFLKEGSPSAKEVIEQSKKFGIDKIEDIVPRSTKK